MEFKLNENQAAVIFEMTEKEGSIDIIIPDKDNPNSAAAVVSALADKYSSKSEIVALLEQFRAKLALNLGGNTTSTTIQ